MKAGNGKTHVLIAEDSPTQAAQLAYLLEQNGFTVSIVADGRAALAFLEGHRPTLLISDVMMPELDGYGLCKAMKSDERFKHIPVMLVTTLGDSLDVIKGLECGADNFIRKPYDEKYLLSRIHYLLMNLELRKTQRMQMGVEISLGDAKYFITAERQQILDLLISTYEQAVQVNDELKAREQELAHSNQVLKGLYLIAEGLNRAGSEQDAAEWALERAMELPGIQAGWISLWDPTSGFTCVAVRNLPPALAAADALEGECFCRRALVSGALDHVTNILECERLAKATGDTRGLRYHASVPLWLGDRTLGVMNLVGPEKGLFTEDELKVLYSVGNQVAVALDRARLHGHLEHLVAERTAKLEAEIEQRKRVEKEQARLVAIIEATPDLVATLGLDGIPLYCNRAGLDILGVEPAQAVSTLGISRCQPEWAAKLVVEQGIPDAMEHGSWSGESALLRPDGGERPVSQVIVAHRGEDGSVEYLSTIMRDISQSKLAEAALKKNQTLLNETGMLANVGGWEFHLDTQELVWTAEVFRIHELEPSHQMTLDSAIGFYAPASRPVIEQAVRDAIERGEAFDVELEIITARGHRRWVHSVGKADREQGRIHGAVQDITQQKQAEAQLNESVERLRQISENINEVFWMTDLIKGEMLYINPAYEAVWGRTAASLYASPQDWLDAIHSDDRARVLESAQTKQVAGLYDEQYRIVRPDGSIRWIHDRAFPVRNGNGEVYRIVGVAEDVTLREENEKRIMRLSRLYAVLSGINAAIVRTRARQELFDEACRIAVEQGGFRMAWLGLLDADGITVTPVARAGVEEGYLDNICLTAVEDAPDACQMVARALREKVEVICNDIGSDPQMARWREEALRRGYRSVAVFPLQVGDQVVGLLLFYASESDFFDKEETDLLTELAGDISFAMDNIEKEQRLNYLAYYDVLTGLPNRALLYDRLEQGTRAARRNEWRLAVLFVDLDNFKVVNDTLGHSLGDALLQEVSRRLAACLRDTDTVGRLGGDEFGIILPEIGTSEDAAMVAAKVIESCQQPYLIGGNELFVSASVGITLFPDDAADSEALIRNADTAMYRAKDLGRNTYQFFTAQMNRNTQDKLRLEADLRYALGKGEFLLHYQPKVSCASGVVTGFEALLRWQHPERGLVGPDAFIPALEETGLIVEVGAWVLESACAQAKRWHDAGLGTPSVAVNISGRQIHVGDLCETVAKALAASGLDPAQLELELTESQLMKDAEGIIGLLRRLKAMGVSLSVDDFGTGYSSLAYLKRFPIDSLKVDRAFVRDIIADPNDVSITRAIITLAHSLKLKVVAEGVETEGQLGLLIANHCDEVQGYYFSRPLPAEQATALL
ncbi:MAG TPA: EAL domain-containing protein, partial [Rhodocyclaceae bacterium]|nr:EAL domain-containing protein [Rhodocyclaceae bacterium]